MQRRYRLRRSADFDLFRRSDQRWHHPLVVLVIKVNGLPFSRFAFLASKKVGKATRRNRAKRLLREAVRERFDSIRPGWDCLLIAKRGTSQAQYQEVKVAVEELLNRAQLILVSEQRD
jgi:ribonuclease P protein component